MKTRQNSSFVAIRTEGAILPADVIRRVVENDKDLPGLAPSDYHLPGTEKINEAVNRSWSRLLGAWSVFKSSRSNLPSNDPATAVTRERWLMPLFQELGYGRLLPNRAALSVEGRDYAISHLWQHTPIHLIGAGLDLDRRAPGVAGAAKATPHSLVQEFLNRSEAHLWAILSNGLRLRLLRDNKSLTRQAFVEFDLEGIFDGLRYPEFTALWLIVHQSRVEAEQPDQCLLEQWSRNGAKQGARVLDRLRDGITEAIQFLGAGFLRHKPNDRLRRKLKTGALAPGDYYRQLLRIVYRLLFLLVAEDRDLLHDPTGTPEAGERYRKYYSTERLRRLAAGMRGTPHVDLWPSLRVVFTALDEAGSPQLALPALDSFLWSRDSVPDLITKEHSPDIANRDLLDAFRSLAFTVDGKTRRPVDFRNLGAEELGSVYESLLELVPDLNLDTAEFVLRAAGGNERKTTGSYYTPSSLISCLLDSALDPVLAEAAKKGEAAILDLKICDPACGSGHFLIAAANRIAKRLAAVRTGEEEPSPEALRHAKRDVIGRCIHGVDINPMAVELCKVALWMESLEPGKPLSFLDHRIQCGNALIGATPELLREGIPDEAFAVLEGDDKAVTAEAKKRNKKEKVKKQGYLFDMAGEPWQHLGNLAAEMVRLEDIPDDSVEGVRTRAAKYAEYVHSQDYRYNRLWADAWCAAFVWKKTLDSLPPITEEVFRAIERSPFRIDSFTQMEIQRLAAQYQFFHWHLAFPEVFDPEGRGGFDCVLGNPPWDQLQLDPQEFFAVSSPEIANAQHMSARTKAIQKLKSNHPELFRDYEEEKRKVQGFQNFVHASTRFPLTSFGRLNSAPLFAEMSRRIIQSHGMVGIIVPTGIATDSFNQFFFSDLIKAKVLVSLFDFENAKGLFPGVHRSYKFCLMTLSGLERKGDKGANFVFFAHQPEQILEKNRRFQLSPSEVELLNPNTKTCSIFRTGRDAEITKGIYRRVPVLVNEALGEEGNPWGFRGLLMFMMNTASNLFQTRVELDQTEWGLRGNIFIKGEEHLLPLYEAKMLHQYDHRWATYNSNTDSEDFSKFEKQNPDKVVLPRYWVPSEEVQKQLAGKWNRNWLLGWRDICRSTDERTVIASILPRSGVGHKFPIILSDTDQNFLICLYSNLNSFALDYLARQKIGGTSLTYFYLKQFPMFPPKFFERLLPWGFDRERIWEWIAPKVVELTFTAHDVRAFARDCGYMGEPFRWHDERRFLMRCELDAAFFHLYGINRDDADYILDTFPIVRRKDEQHWGEFRTKRVILEIYDEMAHAMAGGPPYRTRLDPPPANGWVPPPIPPTE